MRGDISSHWRLSGSRHGQAGGAGGKRSDVSFALDVSVPVNARARVSLPTLGLEQVSVSEGGEAVWQDGAFRAGPDGITAARARAGYIDLEVGSGAYRFVLTGD